MRAYVLIIAVAAAVAVGRATDDLKSGFVLVANQQSASASLIDLSKDSVKSIPVGTGPHEAVISPSGRVGLVTLYGTQPPGNQLAVLDLPAGTIRKTISLGEFTRPHGANFLAGDESRVVVTSETTQNVVLVNLSTGATEAIGTGATGSHMVAVTADGRRAFTANVGGGSVSEIDLVAKKLVRTIPTAPGTEGIAVAPDGSTVWAGSNAKGTVAVIDTRSGAIVETIGGLVFPYRLAVSNDGKIAIICDPKGDKLAVADVATRKIVWTLDGIGSPRGVNIAPGGRTAFVTLAADETMGVVDLVARKLTRKIKVEKSPDGVWYGPVPRQ
jgi:DNA-binding beta-propeller fold protein YncE